MTRKEKVFKVLSRKHAEKVLGLIYMEEEISFKDVCASFNVSKSTIRQIINSLVATKLIKSKKNAYSQDRRAKVYYVSDVSTVICLLELDL